jgi:hypothetical protein
MGEQSVCNRSRTCISHDGAVIGKHFTQGTIRWTRLPANAPSTDVQARSNRISSHRVLWHKQALALGNPASWNINTIISVSGAAQPPLCLHYAFGGGVIVSSRLMVRTAMWQSMARIQLDMQLEYATACWPEAASPGGGSPGAASLMPLSSGPHCSGPPQP